MNIESNALEVISLGKPRRLYILCKLLIFMPEYECPVAGILEVWTLETRIWIQEAIEPYYRWTSFSECQNAKLICFRGLLTIAAVKQGSHIW